MKIVEYYKTPDGKLFPTKQQAERHETDLLGNLLDNFSTNYFNIAHRPSIYQAVVRMQENKGLLRAQLIDIISILDDEDE